MRQPSGGLRSANPPSKVIKQLFAIFTFMKKSLTAQMAQVLRHFPEDLEGESAMPSTDEWDNRYLTMAKLIANWSKDPNAKVGAVIVRDNRVVATGFNGFPTHVQDDARLLDKATKQVMVVHAEENALLVAGERAKDATIYVHGKPICARCAASIIQSGISRVVSMKPSQDVSSIKSRKSSTPKDGHVDWNKMGEIACEMFAETNIQVHHKSVDDSSISIPANDPVDIENESKLKAK